MVQLILADQSHIDKISELAHAIWNDHYVPIIGQEQVDYMLAEMYNKENLKLQLEVNKHQFYMIHKDQVCVGFMSVSSNNQADYFLHKFYIHHHESSNGIGTECLNILIELLKPKKLTLTVNRQNYKSINFYFKNGFVIDRVEDFDIGNGFVMNDFVMVRNIK
jgi:ribosomal protein S18 acetylase RimI-like enzyme